MAINNETSCGGPIIKSSPALDESFEYKGEGNTLEISSTMNENSRLSEDAIMIRSRKETAYSEDLSNYFVPRRELSQDERLQRYSSYLDISEEKMKSLMEDFIDELKLGLLAHKAHPYKWNPEECSFKMIDSCIKKLPGGNEKGVFYALDFGGTNMRAVRVELLGNGRVKKSQVKHSLKYVGPSARDKGLLDANSTAKDLFNHFSNQVKKIMESSGDLQKCIDEKSSVPVGFTFSFPSIQTEITNAVLLQWTKGFETGRKTADPVENRDVGKLLTEAFTRNNTPAHLIAILNDTVGTMMSCAYQKDEGYPDCLIGIILGTGSNGCYYEFEAPLYGYAGNIINIEFGNFNKNLPLTEVDLELDWHTVNKGFQLFEKLISGAYLGELVRKFVIRIFQYRTPASAWIEETLTTEDVAKISSDDTDDLFTTRAIIFDKWSLYMDHLDLVDIRKICLAVLDRSAKLAATAICAIAVKTNRLSTGLTCAVDGSLYVKNPWYADRVRTHMTTLLGPKLANNIVVCPSDDGSGKGAAIVAATVHNNE